MKLDNELRELLRETISSNKELRKEVNDLRTLLAALEDKDTPRDLKRGYPWEPNPWHVVTCGGIKVEQLPFNPDENNPTAAFLLNPGQFLPHDDNP